MVIARVCDPVDRLAVLGGGLRPHVTGPRQEPGKALAFGRVEQVRVALVGQHRQRALVAVQLGIDPGEQHDAAALGGHHDRLDQCEVGRREDLLQQEEAVDGVDGSTVHGQDAVGLGELSDVAGDRVDTEPVEQTGHHAQSRRVGLVALWPVRQCDHRPSAVCRRPGRPARSATCPRWTRRCRGRPGRGRRHTRRARDV